MKDEGETEVPESWDGIYIGCPRARHGKSDPTVCLAKTTRTRLDAFRFLAIAIVLQTKNKEDSGSFWATFVSRRERSKVIEAIDGFVPNRELFFVEVETRGEF